MKIPLYRIGKFFRRLFGRRKDLSQRDELTPDLFDDGIKKLEGSYDSEALGLSAEAWTFIAMLLVDAIKMVRDKLYKDGKYKKPNIWTKIALGGYFISFIFKLIIRFKK